MQISFSRPLDLAWSRMKSLLFGPFDLGLWFVLGFTAWLAQLGESGFGGATSRITSSDSFETVHWDHWGDNAMGSVRDFLSDGLTAVLVGLMVIAGLVIWLLLLWISSRGRFMLLDNLVHRRSRVQAPWQKFRAQGDSLFLWQIVYTLVASVTVLGLVIGGFLLWVPLAALSASALVAIPLAILTGSLFVLVILVAVYIEFFLTAFVVPLMYRDGLTATQAWSRWLPLFRDHPGSFVLYGLLYGGIVIVGWILFLAAGLATCCAGWLLLALPYVGSVITLPLTVFCGYLNLEFLGQFGEDFRTLPPLASVEIQGDGTVVRPQDRGQDAGPQEPGPQDF